MSAGGRAEGEQPRPLRIGARKSPLAVAQAEYVAGLLAAHGVTSELVGITTQGDTDRRHLTEIGGTGVFAAAVREALLDGTIDLAVHSMKDLPVAPVPGLVVAAVPEREDPRDVLVGTTLAGLRSGMVIGTGSPRRRVQLDEYARDRGITLEFVPIRGNVDRRLSLVRDGEVDATLLAAAGMIRLGRLAELDLPHQLLPLDVMAPAAGQAALALEIRSDAEAWITAAVETTDHPASAATSGAEREFLGAIEAGCMAPVGVTARLAGDHARTADLTLSAVIGRTGLSNADDVDPDAPLVRLEQTVTAGRTRGLARRMADSVLAQLSTNSDQTRESM